MTRTPALKFHTAPKRRYPEAILQQRVVQHLALAGTPNMIYYHVANEGKRSPRSGAYLKSLGMRPGAADLAMVRNGQTYFLELKATGGKPTDLQLSFATDAAAAGAHWAWADNLERAITILRDWGLLRRMAKQ